MKKGGSKKQGLHITINLTNRWLYTLITIGIIAILGVGVYAYSGNVGHTSDQIDVTWAQIQGIPADIADGDQIGTISTNPLYVDGAITAPEGTLRDNGGGWIRTYGNTGWYSQTYGGGWYMTDTTWLRAYGDKSIYTPANLQVDGTIDGGLIRGTLDTYQRQTSCANAISCSISREACS